MSEQNCRQRGLSMSSPLAFIVLMVCGLGFASLGWHAKTAYEHYCAVVNMRHQIEMMKIVYQKKPVQEGTGLVPSPSSMPDTNPEETSFDKPGDPDCGPRG